MQDFNGVFKDLLARLNKLDKRLTALETHEYIKLYPVTVATDYLIHQTILDGVTYDSGNLRGTGSIPAQAKGFFGVMWITPIIATVDVYISPGGVGWGVYYQQYKWATTAITNSFHYSQMLFCPLGSAGNITVTPVGADVEVFINAIGYWM